MPRSRINPEAWIHTFSGRQFFPGEPYPEDVCIEDIAHALSMLCRYNGHSRDFYSVAQHSVIVAAMLPQDDQIYGLLHDASEAYLTDVPRPTKPLLTNYREIEAGVQEAVYRHFELDSQEPYSLTAADRAICVAEKADLLGPSAAPWSFIEGVERPFDRKIVPWSPSVAEAYFLEAFGMVRRGLTLHVDRYTYGP